MLRSVADLQAGRSARRPSPLPPMSSMGAALVALALQGCGSGGGGEVAGGAGALPGPAPAPVTPILIAATIDAQDGRFRTHVVCATCHSNGSVATAMRDSAGREVAPVNLWRATMMANAFRDPYFRAVLAAEVDARPAHGAAIEDTCLSCHAPQAAYEAHQAGGLQSKAELYAAGTARAQVGLDGVSCTLCHQVEATGLGAPASFSAGFVVSPTRVAYGPHASPFAAPMLASSGHTPTPAAHTSESRMCASCHTLHTTVFDASGGPTAARFPEQVPYLEWRNSVYSTEATPPGPSAASCQDCHMPKESEDGVPIGTRIARRPSGDDFPPIAARQPFGRHAMVGGNTIVLSILRDRAADLGPSASTADFDRSIAATRASLQGGTASVQIQGLGFAAGRLAFDVLVTNRAGHKLPTSYPSRRAWLRVAVRGGQGVVWRSGDHDAAGRIVDGAGLPLASERAGGPIEPHRTLVTQPSQAQVYEAVLEDAAGAPTFELLRAARHRKDNRLLPEGWSSGHPDIADMAPAGVAGDADFVGGSDRVRYEVAGLPAGTYAVDVELLFQTIGARHAAELFLHDDVAEVAVFRRYYEAADLRPERLAADSRTTP